MVSAMDFRQGITFKMDGVVYEVVQFQHVQRPRLAPLVRAKIRNYKNGNVVERTFSPDDRFDDAILQQRDLQFSFKDGENFVFIDSETYEQHEFTPTQIGEGIKYLKEEMNITMLTHDGEVMGVKIPNKVELMVKEAPPGIKGDTAGTARKPVVLETGAVINVPLFINEGEIIRVDTRTNEYIERVNK
ncbi:MAG: elongation factor P [bacterium]